MGAQGCRGSHSDCEASQMFCGLLNIPLACGWVDNDVWDFYFGLNCLFKLLKCCEWLRLILHQGASSMNALLLHNAGPRPRMMSGQRKVKISSTRDWKLICSVQKPLSQSRIVSKCSTCSSSACWWSWCTSSARLNAHIVSRSGIKASAK